MADELITIKGYDYEAYLHSVGRVPMLNGETSMILIATRAWRRLESYEDCRAGKPLRDVAMEVIGYSKELGEEDRDTYMARIHNCLYPNLKDLVVEPADDITLDEWEAKVRPEMQTLFVSFTKKNKEHTRFCRGQRDLCP
ncbi:hypothetical protein QR685DRAFT_541534 [Neurospora intermedia]|uniref:Uncharacterized protein n=1 Tax=Neurospora intermedia TaxID=5142 RepID=A0ABR3DJI6_NEUIN